MSNHVAIIFIGTNSYVSFFENYYNTVKEKFLPNTKKTFFVFTDISHPSVYRPDVVVIPTKHILWPYITLFRFQFINTVVDKMVLFGCTHLIFIDADMYINSLITEQEFFVDTIGDKPLFGVQHPGFIKQVGTFERRPNSFASVNPTKDLSVYWQGCFWGGKLPEVIEMTRELEDYTQRDLDNGIVAVWHDESHLNRYYVEHKEMVATFHSGYAYPEKWNLPFEKKIIHIAKNNQELHK